jgi:hypothetical protein
MTHVTGAPKSSPRSAVRWPADELSLLGVPSSIWRVLWRFFGFLGGLTLHALGQRRMIDRFTKTILTVIAASLVILIIQNFENRTARAQVGQAHVWIDASIGTLSSEWSHRYLCAWSNSRDVLRRES